MPIFTPSQVTALTAVSVSLSALSFIGSGFIIYSYASFPELRKFSFKLIFLMSCADCAACIAYFFGSPATGSPLCTVQGLMEQGCQLSSIVWTTIISYTLWNAVVKREAVTDKMNAFLFFGFALPALTCVLPLSTGSFANTGAWCWIDQSDVGTVWRFALFYVPLWSAIIFNGYTYWLVIDSMKELFKTQNSEIPSKYRALINRLKLYPIILVGCWFFGTINRFQQAVAPNSPQYWLFVLQVCGSHLQGLLNAVAYGLNPSVRDAWVEKLAGHARLEGVARFLKPPGVELRDGEEEGGMAGEEGEEETAL